MKLMSQKSPVCLPKGILFDTDNTLYDYLPAHQAAIDAVCQKCVSKLSISPKEFEKVYEAARSQIKFQLGNTLLPQPLAVFSKNFGAFLSVLRCCLH